MTELTPDSFDRSFPHTRNRRRIIWTLEAIGSRIGVSADFVRDTIVRQPGSPIKKMGSRWYVYEDELDRFMETGPR